jgi:hypothetical protein
MNEMVCCPITVELMADPVVTCDGHTYERQAIERWFQRGNQTSPLTGLALSSTLLYPNYALKQLIDEMPTLSQLQRQLLKLEDEIWSLQKELAMRESPLVDCSLQLPTMQSMGRCKEEKQRRKRKRQRRRRSCDALRERE